MCFAWRSPPPLIGTPTLNLQLLSQETKRRHTQRRQLYLLVVASNWSRIRLGNCTFLSCWVCLDCETKEDYSASSRRPHLEGSLAVENKKKGGKNPLIQTLLHLLLHCCRFGIYMSDKYQDLEMSHLCFWISKRTWFSCYMFWSSADINISVRRSWKYKNDFFSSRIRPL